MKTFTLSSRVSRTLVVFFHMSRSDNLNIWNVMRKFYFAPSN